MQSGDKVICIGSGVQNITKGRMYEIIGFDGRLQKSNGGAHTYIKIMNNLNNLDFFPKHLFKTLSDYRNDLISEICK